MIPLDQNKEKTQLQSSELNKGRSATKPTAAAPVHMAAAIDASPVATIAAAPITAVAASPVAAVNAGAITAVGATIDGIGAPIRRIGADIGHTAPIRATVIAQATTS